MNENNLQVTSQQKQPAVGFLLQPLPKIVHFDSNVYDYTRVFIEEIVLIFSVNWLITSKFV